MKSISLTIWGLDNKLPARLVELQQCFRTLSQLHLTFQKGLCNSVDCLPQFAPKCLYSLSVRSERHCDVSFTAQVRRPALLLYDLLLREVGQTGKTQSRVAWSVIVSAVSLEAI